MKRPVSTNRRLTPFLIAGVVLSTVWAEPSELPEPLKPWEGWATWEDKHQACPTPFNSAEVHFCYWPHRLALTVGPSGGSWEVAVAVFEAVWVQLPGSEQVWPAGVRMDGEPIPVLSRKGVPAVKLPAGRHQLSGGFAWDLMPQRLAIPKQIGLLTLVVEGDPILHPSWDAQGHVWLKRLPSDVADQDLLSAQVHRVLEDGIPQWLRTELELTVSGKNREESLGWLLPEGWVLSMVDSPIPVAIDETGQVKVQVRAGKWTIRADAFRTTDVGEFQFAQEARPITELELIGFKAEPGFRLVEFEGVQAVDVTQTRFPGPWRDLPVYQWNTGSAFRVVERMRGMGLQRPEGLSIERQFWLDEDGRGLTYRDRISGQMQQIWRLDVAEGQSLGAVRIENRGQLITANPQTGAPGVELRTRNLNLEAIGRMNRPRALPAVGWRTDVDSLRVTWTLPPGWRVFALLGADQVDGDWLTAWSLLDLFLLLIFTLAVFRIWGWGAGVVAFFAFGLSYHELGSPRLTWFFLLLPLALLRVVSKGPASRWLKAWKYLAAILLVLWLVPFVASQVQGALYPQLESPGLGYGSRGFLGIPGAAYRRTAAAAARARVRVETQIAQDLEAEATSGTKRGASYGTDNLRYAPKVRIQTGPAEPTWSWSQVTCRWNGPVSEAQQLKPILISSTTHRVLTVLRLALIFLLASILFQVRGVRIPFFRRFAGPAVLAAALLLPGSLEAQIPDSATLKTMRERLLEPSDAYPHAAEIASARLTLNGDRMTLACEIHAAKTVAVPLPGRLPAWSPLSVAFGDPSHPVVVMRRDGFLWLLVPPGVHPVTVEGRLPDVPEWEWTYLLKPRHVAIEAPGWNVSGVGSNGIPEDQVFFTRAREASETEAAYDRTDFQAVVVVNRYLEIGLVWQVRTEVVRLSRTGKAVSLMLPLLPNESVLTADRISSAGFMETRLGANQETFTWQGELPSGEPIRLEAASTDQWVERWYLVTSPVWNASLSGLEPLYEPQEQHLVPTWYPWPGEIVVLAFNRPEAIGGETVTVRQVAHETSLGSRQRTSQLRLDLECSLGTDFILELNAEADISSLKLADQALPVRRDGPKLIIPVSPGKQTVEIAWRTSERLATVVVGEPIGLPVDAANITTVMRVPANRWVLWVDGPLRGPAVRFWTILIVAILAAWALGSLSLSPLRRLEWVLLGLGLTQVHLAAALVVVGWLFLLAWRGKLDTAPLPWWRFNLLQLVLAMLTLVVLGILLVAVGEGLLGRPEMFILGNGSSQTRLQWFQPRAGSLLPAPTAISISVWYYRLLMLFWALWLAAALLRWLQWGWRQSVQGGGWKNRTSKPASLSKTA